MTCQWMAHMTPSERLGHLQLSLKLKLRLWRLLAPVQQLQKLMSRCVNSMNRNASTSLVIVMPQEA